MSHRAYSFCIPATDLETVDQFVQRMEAAYGPHYLGDGVEITDAQGRPCRAWDGPVPDGAELEAAIEEAGGRCVTRPETLSTLIQEVQS